MDKKFYQSDFQHQQRDSNFMNNNKYNKTVNCAQDITGFEDKTLARSYVIVPTKVRKRYTMKKNRSKERVAVKS